MDMEETNEITTESDAGDAAETADVTPVLAVERDRPRRRPLVPRAVWAGILGVTAVLALLIAVGMWYVSGIGISVPDVTGVQEGVARARLAQAGLAVSTVERRFDLEPQGAVLSQNPSFGARLPRGGAVALVVSAGTEEFVMPDVIGQGINVARAQLEQAGLVVRIEAIDSEQPADTVLETVPAPGVTVRTSDVVRLRIASDGTASSALLPFALQGMVFVIDPEPIEGSEIDPPMEVSRRLRSLLEASEAEVLVTRQAGEVDIELATRAQRAAGASAPVTVLIGLDVVPQAPVGLGVVVPGEDTLPAAQVEASARFADALIELLAEQHDGVTRATLGSDPVAAATTAPVVRVRLGSLDSREDAAAFRDPGWSDSIARAIYRAIGERFAGE
ncbi:MAG: PASTA domain-containing protein [Anaerosomatales bacterium]|nr:PASTA domain-containing protein [Anaerosomatales bacterium]MDT8433434.1 PASTA domain-containing protein [Anaerosomatales bacterium]